MLNETCPKCNSHDIDENGQGIDVEGDMITHEQKCRQCGAYWKDLYTYIESVFPDGSRYGR